MYRSLVCGQDVDSAAQKIVQITDEWELHIRDMALEDVPQIARLEREIFRSPWSETSFNSIVRQDRESLCVVGTVSGMVVTYAVCWVLPPEVHIANIAVARDFRRHGIADILLRTILDTGGARGCSIAHLEVRASNHAAISLYEKYGFRTVGLRKGYYENSEDALLMSLTY